MKICSKTSIVTVPALVAAGLVTALSSVLFSCTKEPGVGDGIRFRASAYSSSGSPSTKTVYGSIANTSQNYQMLNWVEGDMVRIYSPQAGLQEDASNHFDDCVVDGVSTDGNISVATVSSTHGNGLVWGEANPHYFYAVYPSPAVNSKVIITGTGNTVTVAGTIPATQTLSWSGVLGTPDMRYAYMYASTTSAPNSQVDLQFRPMFTAFQFEIGPGEYTSIHLTGFTLSTTDATSQLSGIFSLSGVAGSETISWGTGTSTLSVSMDATLTTGNTLILTVFALPIDLGQLSISFTGDEIGTRSLALKQGGVYISFDACKKYRIYGLSFPKADDIEGEGEDINWDGSIDVTSGGETVTWVSSIVGEGTSDGAITWDNRDGTVPGEFSVSASQKVFFAKGNLIARLSSSEIGQDPSRFYLAANQWDYVYNKTTGGYNSGNTSLASGRDYDLFCWSADGASSYKWGIATGSVSYEDFEGGSFRDWGNNTIYADATSSTVYSGSWRTLTSEEWRYLFNTRTTTNNYRFARAKVHSINGMIIFPDNYDTSKKKTFSNVNVTNTAWNSVPSVSDSEWTTMEEAGCVFLPCTGYRYNNGTLYYGGIEGYYWTSSSPADYPIRAFYIGFSNDYTTLFSGNDYRNSGYSVRLVQNK